MREQDASDLEELCNAADYGFAPYREPRERITASLELVAEQAARIAELEQLLTQAQAQTRVTELHSALKSKVLALPVDRIKDLEAERDAVRAALAWASENDTLLCYDLLKVSTDGDSHLTYDYEHSGESIQAALLKAWREGGGG